MSKKLKSLSFTKVHTRLLRIKFKSDSKILHKFDFKIKGYSQNLAKVNRDFHMVRIGQFQQF